VITTQRNFVFRFTFEEISGFSKSYYTLLRTRRDPFGISRLLVPSPCLHDIPRSWHLPFGFCPMSSIAITALENDVKDQQFSLCVTNYTKSPHR
jgi:hypothetical protein